jgi:hypothetical protein
MRKRSYVEDVLHVLSKPVPSEEAAQRVYERALVLLETDHVVKGLWNARVKADPRVEYYSPVA